MHDHEDVAVRRTGRWRTGRQSRRRILTAARTLFMRDGYDRATVRAIAREAGSDAGMVYYFFGSKEKLFVQVLAETEHPLNRLAPLLDEGLEGIGERLVRTCLERWDAGEYEALFAVFFHSAIAQRNAADHIRKFVEGPIGDRLTREFGITQTPLRLELVTVHLMGLAVARYQLKTQIIASADHETLVDWMGPTIQRYLTAPDPASRPAGHG